MGLRFYLSDSKIDGESDRRGLRGPHDRMSVVTTPPGQAGSCVLLASFETEELAVIQVTRVAESLGYSVVRPETRVEPNKSALATTIEAIRDANVVVAILSEVAQPGMWFELGLAAGSAAPVLAVLVGRVALPPSSTGLRTIGPVLTDRALEMALAQVANRPAIQILAGSEKRTGIALGEAGAKFQASLESLPRTAAGGAAGAAFEDWFRDLLEAAQVPFSQSAHVPDTNLPRAFSYMDFAVSIDELRANLGDPLPVELVLGVSDRVVSQRKKLYESFLRATGARTLLVISAAVNEPANIIQINHGEALTCSANLLLDEMRLKPFGLAVLAIRNRAAQGTVER